MNMLKLYQLIRKINKRKKEGFTCYKVTKEYPDYLTPAEKQWLKAKTGCEISEYTYLDDPSRDWYTLFKWQP